MALLGNFLCCLLVAWLCRRGLGVPLAPAYGAPAVGEWTDRDCTGRWRGSAKSRWCVGGWAQDAATLVSVAQGQTARSLGLSHGEGAPWGRQYRTACWAFVYIPGLGCSVPLGGKSEVVVWWEKPLRVGYERFPESPSVTRAEEDLWVPTPECSFSPILSVLFCSAQ